MTRPSGTDFIALYSPATTDISSALPIQVQNAAAASASYLQDGAGSAT